MITNAAALSIALGGGVLAAVYLLKPTRWSPIVWPARDRIGRDVVIKAVSGSIPTKELRALRLLHSDDLRDDPRNHTIPVLDYLEFNGQVFAVMPRQGWNAAIWADFATVGEVVRYGQAFFEAIAFLHEHYIAHGDTIGQNFVMDVMVPKPKEFGVLYAGVRGPERKYAFIDFETATLPVLSSDSSSSDKPSHQTYSPAPEFAIASKHEVARLARNLEFHLRCIEDVVPDLGTLLELMKDCDSPDQPTAAAALSRYEEICNLLSTDDMHREVEAIWWEEDRIKYRDSPPLHISDC
ncbi:hypothetical protein CPB85DRAFT_1440922 [Mucidula mucida]|nr:hypothetical protein CPB85DRAFT_1440922 [Mucidula mucida]